MANSGRQRALRILEMARSIGMVFSEDDKAEDLFSLLGRPAPQAGAFSSWRQARLAAFKGAR